MNIVSWGMGLSASTSGGGEIAGTGIVRNAEITLIPKVNTVSLTTQKFVAILTRTRNVVVLSDEQLAALSNPPTAKLSIRKKNSLTV